ncbi:VOC family protein [Scopulibacillus darangshiensis]|nr:VOC family protein [Scopulibacillus darangshiensis]
MEFHCDGHIYPGQVELKVENLKRSILFYQEVIGFRILEQTETKALLTANGQTSLLTIEQPESVIQKQPHTTGLYHFALLLPNRTELGKILNHFIKLDLPLGASDHLVSEALYLNDPDGNGIEIYADRPAATWQWENNQVIMVTDPLDGDSLLKEVDGEDWQGLPADTIMGHIHLHVSDLAKDAEFYCKGLGFDIVSKYGGQALFISTGGYHHHIGLNTWAGVGAPKPSEHSVGLNWYSLIYPNGEAIQAAITRLQKIGAVVKKENGFFLTKDPSGHNIRLAGC